MGRPRHLREFSQIIRALPRELTLDDTRHQDLELYRDDRISIYYAPFDFLNRDARIAVVGVTPGPTQIVESLITVRDAIESGDSEEVALRQVKERASFKGMRGDLARWMDEIGLAALAGVDSCAALFDDPRLLHTTSAIRYPTFKRKRDRSWIRYSGTSPDILGHPKLIETLEQTLLPELLALRSALIVPLGKANRAIVHLIDRGALERDRCVLGLPHPSPASPNRERYFREAKARLIAQTRTTPRMAQERSSGETIEIALTQGNINNNHIYLRRHLDFFPADALGPSNAKDGLGTELTVRFDGLSDPVATDIAGGNKLFFRARAPVGEFFRRHKLGAGDRIRIERLGHYEFRVRRPK